MKKHKSSVDESWLEAVGFVVVVIAVTISVGALWGVGYNLVKNNVQLPDGLMTDTVCRDKGGRYEWIDDPHSSGRDVLTCRY